MSMSSAPAWYARAMPSPVYSQELDVTRQALPMPPVAITIDFALNTMKRPFSRKYANAPATRPPSINGRVSFSEKRFADHADGGALRERFDGSTQPCSAGANNENVVFAGLVVCRHRSLKSRNAPQATMRT